MASTVAHHARLQRGNSSVNVMTTRDKIERGVIWLVDGVGRALECLRFPSSLLPQHVAPLSATDLTWRFVHTLAIITIAIAVPCRLAFGRQGHAQGFGDVLVDLLLCDAVFFGDIVVGLRSSFIDDGTQRLIHGREMMQKRYIAQWLWVDLLSVAVPQLCGVTHVLLRGACEQNSMLIKTVACAGTRGAAAGTALHIVALLLRLARLAKLMQYFRDAETFFLCNNRKRKSLQMLKLGFSMFLCMHAAGCGWFIIGRLEGFPEGNEFLPPARLRLASTPTLTQYLHACYWGFVAMTGLGPGVREPQTGLEHTFMLFVMVAGLVLFATLVGSLSAAFSRGDARFQAFAEEVEAVNLYMASCNLPEDLRRRVRYCCEYQFATGAASKGAAALQTLPKYLLHEVLVCINREIISKVPLFKGCHHGFVNALVPYLKPQALLPGDVLILEGTVASEMYFIRSGTVEVVRGFSSRKPKRGAKASHVLGVNASGDTTVASGGGGGGDGDGNGNGGAHRAEEQLALLSEGSYIGEIALLFREKRSATVRAISFVSLFMLQKEDFDVIAKQFPDDLASMTRIALMRRKSTQQQTREAVGSGGRSGTGGGSKGTPRLGGHGNPFRRQFSADLTTTIGSNTEAGEDEHKGKGTQGGAEEGMCTTRAYPLLSEEVLDTTPMASYVRKRSVSASLPHVARASRRMSERRAVSAAAEKQPWLLAQAAQDGDDDIGGIGNAHSGTGAEPAVSSPVLRGVQEESGEEDEVDEDEDRCAAQAPATTRCGNGHSLSDTKAVGGNDDDDGDVQWF